jgi:hypothetical protein
VECRWEAASLEVASGAVLVEVASGAEVTAAADTANVRTDDGCALKGSLESPVRAQYFQVPHAAGGFSCQSQMIQSTFFGSPPKSLSRVMHWPR